MTTNYQIKVEDIFKAYKMYDKPIDRLKEAFSISQKKYHKDFYALKNISIKINKGEILGLIGRNGAGKSTLLKIITGVLTPTSGSVEVKGKISSLLELGAGFNPEYTGIENIYFYGTLMGFSKEEMDQKKEDIIKFAEIGDHLYQPVKTYSSGMFARLAFSCAINVEPDILIVDEILSVGDIRFQAKCFNKFEEFKKNGVTILYVGHDISLIRTFCDRAIWLNNGEILEEGDPLYVSAKYTEFMYLEENLDNNHLKIQDEIIKDNTELEEVNNLVDYDLEEELDLSKAITHWGTDVGLIKNVELLNQDLIPTNHIEPDDEVVIRIKFRHHENIDYNSLSVAFSIKNKEGIDLIVKTTFDEDIEIKKNKEQVEVLFSLKTHLSIGEYYIVAALENRQKSSILYYEYIEGAQYFKVYTDKKIFGLFSPPTQIIIK